MCLEQGLAQSTVGFPPDLQVQSVSSQFRDASQVRPLCQRTLDNGESEMFYWLLASGTVCHRLVPTQQGFGCYSPHRRHGERSSWGRAVICLTHRAEEGPRTLQLLGSGIPGGCGQTTRDSVPWGSLSSLYIHCSMRCPGRRSLVSLAERVSLRVPLRSVGALTWRRGPVCVKTVQCLHRQRIPTSK